MDHIALRAYIDAKPEFAAWVEGGNDQQIADAINDTTVPVIGNVPRSKFAMWCGITGLRAKIEAHAGNAASPLQSIALTVKDFLLGGSGVDAINMGDPTNVAMLDAWVQADALTTGQKDDLIAMATTNQPVFGQLLHNTDIAKAFGRNGVESWQ